jgi:hypothetical protein
MALELQERFASYGVGLSRQQRPFRVGESDSLSTPPSFEQPILSLEEFDNNQLMPVGPARHDHQQKRQ